MKVLLFASEVRGFNFLKNIHKELINQNYQSVFLYSETNYVLNLPLESNNLYYDTNIPHFGSDFLQLESIGVSIPFTPDYLILTRDRWLPEQGLIHEIKQKFPNIKICYIEVNSLLVQAIEVKMEMISRTKFPQNQIDIFFDSSEYTLKNKKQSLSWEGWEKGIIVGNPYWDNLDPKDIKKCYDKYKIDKNKIQLLFFGEGGAGKFKSYKCLQFITKNINREKYQIFFKPLSGATHHPQLKKELELDFIKNKTDGIITNQNDLIPMSKICEYHIGNISSVNHGGALFNKQLVDLSHSTSRFENYTNINFYLKNSKEVGENYTSDFWIKIHNLKNEEGFKKIVSDKTLKNWDSINNNWKSLLNTYTHSFDFTLNFLTNPKKESFNLLKYFDKFGDRKSSKRIIEYLKDNLIP